MYYSYNKSVSKKILCFSLFPVAYSRDEMSVHTKYNCFVDTQDYRLVNFFDAYYTSQQAFFHHFQAQSGGCVLYITAYYIQRITVFTEILNCSY